MLMLSTQQDSQDTCCYMQQTKQCNNTVANWCETAWSGMDYGTRRRPRDLVHHTSCSSKGVEQMFLCRMCTYLDVGWSRLEAIASRLEAIASRLDVRYLAKRLCSSLLRLGGGNATPGLMPQILRRRLALFGMAFFGVYFVLTGPRHLDRCANETHALRSSLGTRT